MTPDMLADEGETLVGWSSAVYFIPSVGPEYESGLVDAKRVLLLGESHYASDPNAVAEGRRCTKVNFDDYQTCDLWPGNRFWGKLQRIATRKLNPTALESQAAWKRIALPISSRSLLAMGLDKDPPLVSGGQANLRSAKLSGGFVPMPCWCLEARRGIT